jgi:ribosome-associated heat shock protein Hsp15
MLAPSLPTDPDDPDTAPDGMRNAAGDPVRLDKWLWAARFFKTRSLAKQAIESGHVRYDEDRSKVSKTVAIGARLRIRQGWDEIEVVVRGLSDERRGAPQAQLRRELQRFKRGS